MADASGGTQRDTPPTPLAPGHGPNGSLRYAWYVVAVLMFAYTVAFIDRQILSLLVQPIKQDLGVTDTQIGLLSGFAFAIFYTVLGIPIARLADSWNRKYLISMGVLVWSLMTAVCGLAQSYRMLFLARIGVGVGEATISPAAYSMIADYFPRDQLSRAISVYVVGLYLGAGIAVLAGSLVVKFASDAGIVSVPFIGDVRPWQLTFFVVALPGLLVLLLLWTVREPLRIQQQAASVTASGKEDPVSFADALAFIREHGRFFAAHFIGYALLGSVISAYLVWVPEVLRRNYDLPIAQAGILFGIALLVFGTLGPLIGGWFSDRLRSRGKHDAELRATILLGMGMLVFTVAMPLAGSPAVAMPLLCGAMLFLSAPQGLAPAVVQMVSPNRLRAQVTAVFMLIAVLSGYTVGPTLVAVLADYVFRREEALGLSLAVVSGVLIPLGLLALSAGLRPLRGMTR
jgi:MFS family permease